MVGNSKILTVSYGTFSCTLEGFDDSFDTMKAIAEYFRDLAGDDRYFGAEPPQPDADMLAKIAERELARGVSGRSSGNNVVLRPSGLLQTQEDAQTATPEITDQADADDAATDDAETGLTDEQERADMRAKRRARRKAVQLELEEEARAEAAQEEEERVKAEEMAAAQAAKAAAAKAAQQTALANAEELAAQKRAEDEAIAEAEAAEAARQADAQDAAERLKAEARDEAARIAQAAQKAADQRKAEQDAILAASAKAEADAAAAQALADAEAKAIADAQKAEAAAAAAAAAAQDEIKEDIAAPETDADDSIAAKLRRIRAVVGTPAQAAAPQEYSEDEHADVLDDDADQTPNTTANARSAVAALNIAKQDLVEETAPETAPEPEAKQPRARVIKMKKADFEQVIATGQLEEVFEDEDLEKGADSSLSPADEDELMRDLQAAQEADDEVVEALPVMDAELDPVEATQPAVQEAPAQAEAPAEQSAPAQAEVPKAEQASVVERILEKTNEELEEPIGKNRRDAIAQLKAAVAATEAARQMGDTSDPRAETENAFRQDLAEVVRPRRPQAAAAKSKRPAAPLKLVPSQRVDEQTQPAPQAPEEPVRPRRVATLADQGAVETDGNFAEFAQAQGANSLADLLEAAAVYTAEVEGNPVFSRPQIMRRALKVSEGAHSREDGLRFFGTLLREGRIEKIGGGQFQITEATRFRTAG